MPATDIHHTETQSIAQKLLFVKFVLFISKLNSKYLDGVCQNAFAVRYILPAYPNTSLVVYGFKIILAGYFPVFFTPFPVHIFDMQMSCVHPF